MFYIKFLIFLDILTDVEKLTGVVKYRLSKEESDGAL